MRIPRQRQAEVAAQHVTRSGAHTISLSGAKSRAAVAKASRETAAAQQLKEDRMLPEAIAADQGPKRKAESDQPQAVVGV